MWFLIEEQSTLTEVLFLEHCVLKSLGKKIKKNKKKKYFFRCSGTRQLFSDVNTFIIVIIWE